MRISFIRLIVIVVTLLYSTQIFAVEGSYPAFSNSLYQQATKQAAKWYQNKQPADYQQALFNIEAAITIEPDNSEFWFFKGQLLAEMKTAPLLERALTSFLQAVLLNPQHGRGQLMVAQTLFNLGRYELAIRQYQFLLEKDPEMVNSLVVYPLLVSYLSLDKSVEARRYFQDLTEEYPDSMDIQLALAILLKHLGQIDLAQQGLHSMLDAKTGSYKSQDYTRFLLNKWQQEAAK